MQFVVLQGCILDCLDLPVAMYCDGLCQVQQLAQRALLGFEEGGGLGVGGVNGSAVAAAATSYDCAAVESSVA